MAYQHVHEGSSDNHWAYFNNPHQKHIVLSNEKFQTTVHVLNSVMGPTMTIQQVEEYFTTFKTYHLNLWKLLEFPYSVSVHSRFFNFLMNLENLVSLCHLPFYPYSYWDYLVKFYQLENQAQPSVSNQVTTTTNPATQLDPHLIAITKNYYYPLTELMSVEELEEENTNESSIPWNPKATTMMKPLM